MSARTRTYLLWSTSAAGLAALLLGVLIRGEARAGNGKPYTTFTIYLSEIPRGFAGVQDVEARPDRIVVTERGSGREVAIPHSGGE